MMIYQKPPLTFSEMVSPLKKQRLSFSENELKQKLALASYHRLSAYFNTFYLPNSEQFKPDTSLYNIWQLYEFDRLLRQLSAEALEILEIAFRTSLSEYLSHQYGPHWFLKPDILKSTFFQERLISQMNEICVSGADPDIKYYKSNYFQPKLPPSWIILKKLSFGSCVNIFRYLKLLKDKKAIAIVFEHHPTALESWFESLRYTRNLCAHHERLWNRWFVIAPKLDYLYENASDFKHRFYAQAIIISKLLKAIMPETSWKTHLYLLLESHKHLPFDKIGFCKNWQNDSFWENGGSL